MNIYATAKALAGALHADALLQQWCGQTFGKPLAVTLGPDMRKMPDELAAPFAALFCDVSGFTPEHPELKHQLGLVFGIRAEAMTEEPFGTSMLGLEQLVEQVWPMLERIIRSLPGLILTGCELDYMTETHPLVQLAVTLTYNENRPIGRRTL